MRMPRQIYLQITPVGRGPSLLSRCSSLALLPLLLFSAPVAGQEAPVLSSPSSDADKAMELKRRFAAKSETACEVFSTPISGGGKAEVQTTNGRLAAAQAFEAGPQEVVVGCDGYGFSLGRADSYRSKTSRALQALAVVTQLGNEQRVWLISRRDGTSPLLEEITGSLARSAGRGEVFGLDGIEVDLTGFEKGSVVAVHPTGRGRPAEAGQLNVGDGLAVERAQRPGSSGADQAEQADSGERAAR